MAMTTHTAHIAAVHIAARTRAWASDLRLGGGLLFVAGATILMGIITAEALYPGTFSTGANEISDLGGTRPPNSVILQPSATIFNLSMTADRHPRHGRLVVRPARLRPPLGDDPDRGARRWLPSASGCSPEIPELPTPSSRWSRSSPAGSLPSALRD